VDNTAEATAAGALYSDAAGKVAVLAKTARNALIGFVVLGYSLYWSSRGEARAVGNKAAFLWTKFPKFVLGFLLISLLATLGFFARPQLASLANLSRWAFLLTFAGVGLRKAHHGNAALRGRLERCPEAESWLPSERGERGAGAFVRWQRPVSNAEQEGSGTGMRHHPDSGIRHGCDTESTVAPA